MGNNSILATNAALYKKVNFDPEKDFAPISLIGSQANILVVNPNVPVKSLAELIALLRANPGKFNYASSGHGTAAHLAAELFKAEAKVEITHVPYKGGAPALQDVIAGHVHMIFATAASVVPHIQSGKVRALAVTPITAHRGVPGARHHRRARPQGLRRHHLARAGGAGEDAARDRGAAASRHRRGAQRSGGAQIARRSRGRHRRQHAGGICRLHQGGDPEMDRDRARRPARSWIDMLITPSWPELVPAIHVLKLTAS